MVLVEYSRRAAVFSRHRSAVDYRAAVVRSVVYTRDAADHRTAGDISAVARVFKHGTKVQGDWGEMLLETAGGIKKINSGDVSIDKGSL